MQREYNRQIHLDFHTSPYINDVAEDFDAADFISTLKKAHVNSVTVFAKCHHGMAYYNTAEGNQHPALNGKDLAGEMLTALHDAEIRCNLYSTVAWEEKIANEHPEWRQLKKDGTFANIETSADGVTVQPAGWKFLNWLHPDYIEYIKNHISEILSLYQPEGIFLDIVFFHPKGGWSPESVKLRKKHGLMEDTPENQVKFESLALKYFTLIITKHIHNVNPNLTVFYNTPNNLYVTNEFGAIVKDQTHFEIESLPSGFWGYHHFPRLARRLSLSGKPWFGMTGKFQKMWGDFGGLKNTHALEYECFRTQGLGGGNIVGDQLHPRGVLDKKTYETIGEVYQQLEEAEPFYAGSENLPEIGILCPNHPSLDENETNISEEGVVMLCEELHYNCNVISEDDDLTHYKLIILPDSVFVDNALVDKINQYLIEGGKVIISGHSGQNQENWTFNGEKVERNGTVDLSPTFWKSIKTEDLPVIENRVIYSAGSNVKPPKGSKIYIERILPYFKRTDVTYCSHFHAPHNKKDEIYPALFGTSDYLWFSDSIFKEYRNSGSEVIKQALGWGIEKLIGEPECGKGLPSSVLTYPRRKGNDLLVTLLRYLPVKKSLDIDIIDEALTFAGEELRFNKKVEAVGFFPSEIILETKDNKITLPNTKGRLLIKVENYFKS